MSYFSGLEAIIETLDFGVLVTDKVGQIKMINRFAKKLLEINRSEIPACIGDINFSSNSSINKYLKQIFKAENNVIHCKLKFNIKELSAEIKPVIVQGKIIAAMFLLNPLHKGHDLNKDKQLSRLFYTLFQYPSNIYYIYDGQGNLVDANRAAEIYDRISVPELVGKSYKEVIKASSFEKSIVGEVLKSKKSSSIVTRLVEGTNGLTTGIPIFDDAGQIEFVLVIGHPESIVSKMKEELEEFRLVTKRYKEKLLSLSMEELDKEGIVANDPAMIQVIKTAQILATRGASNILITGESGTGKGLLAKFLHHIGQFKQSDFIHINCANLPEHLLEAELFGYEKGAFTGARQEGKIGYFELANKGTLFLDEIGELASGIQAKLLKYLDDHTINRLGGVTPIKIECTIITATNRDLSAMVKMKKFREDLFYRLNTFTISIPPLRKRPLDIKCLTHHYLQKYNIKYSLNRKISIETISKLMHYSFPGNVRELKNMIEMAVLMSENHYIDQIILDKIQDRSIRKPRIRNVDNLPKQLNYLEKNILKQAKQLYKSTREMSKVLKIDQSTVVRKLRKHGLA